jgi:hypothetical protein
MTNSANPAPVTRTIRDMDRDYWTKELLEAERELHAAKGRTALNPPRASSNAQGLACCTGGAQTRTSATSIRGIPAYPSFSSNDGNHATNASALR